MYHTDEEAKDIWSHIPDYTDILITHMPPYKYHDGAPYKLGREGLYVPSLDLGGEPVGCKLLRKRVEEVKPLVHSFGHIHEGYGNTETENTVFINASICTGSYTPVNPPTVVDIDVSNKTVKVVSY